MSMNVLIAALVVLVIGTAGVVGVQMWLIQYHALPVSDLTSTLGNVGQVLFGAAMALVAAFSHSLGVKSVQGQTFDPATPEGPQ